MGERGVDPLLFLSPVTVTTAPFLIHARTGGPPHLTHAPLTLSCMTTDKSSADTPPPAGVAALAPTPTSSHAQKAAGNAALASGDARAALAHYDAALAGLDADEGGPSSNPPLAAILQANRCAAALAAGDARTALAAARSATALAPAWPKAWVRLVRAAGACGKTASAAAAAREGAAVAARARAAGAAAPGEAAEAASALRSLMDATAVAAAAAGDYAGFDGRVLEVRPAAAGEEWLGLPAPAVAGEEGEGGLAALPSTAAATAAAAASTPRPPASSSFRSLHAAVAAAADGDTILLLPGTHNTLSSSVVVDKRVLISGGGLGGGGPPARAATLDARANAPALRLRGPCVLHGLVVEGTGFRETVRLEPEGHGVAEGGRAWAAGGPRAAPLLVECTITSAGDECVSVLAPPRPPSPSTATARWSPTFLRCTFGPAKRSGVSVRGGVHVTLGGCVVERAGGAGVVVARGAAASLGYACTVRQCGGEGVVVMGKGSRLTLTHSTIAECGGPCVDVSCGAGADVRASALVGGEGGGGLWAWGDGSVATAGASTVISAAATYAALCDGGAGVDLREGCVVDGGVCGRVEAGTGARAPGPPPQRWVGPPPATGCFVWTADPLLLA